MKTILIKCRGLNGERASKCFVCPLADLSDDGMKIDCNLKPEDRDVDIKVKVYRETGDDIKETIV